MEERQENVFPETQGDGGGKMKNEKEIAQQLLLPLSSSLVNSKVAGKKPNQALANFRIISWLTFIWLVPPQVDSEINGK